MVKRTYLRAFRLGTFALMAAGAASAATNLTVAPLTLAFTYQAGAALPASQNLQASSPGAVVAVTPAIAGPVPYLGKWLTISGSTSNSTPYTYKVYVNPSGLPAGVYAATITLTAATAANSPVTVPVTLTVGNAAPVLAASPTALAFSYTTGAAAPPAQSVVLSSNGDPLNATIALTGGSWLSAQPTGDIVLIGLPSVLSVSVNPACLLPGAYTGKVTLNSTTASNKSVAVAVALTVLAAVPTTVSVWPADVLVGAPATVVTVTGSGFFSTSTAAVNGIALPCAVLSSSSVQLTVPASFFTTAGNLSLTVTTPAPGGGTSNATPFPVLPPGPQILAIANVASYNTAAITPGGIITIYGSGIGPAGLTLFNPVAGTIATSLPGNGPGTQVTVDGVAAPLLYTGSNQLSAIVPYAVSAKVGQSVNVQVTYNGVPSTIVSVPVVATDPGVFTLNASGQGQAAVLNFDPVTGNYTVNSSANAAASGSTVILYVTGVGQTSPAGVEGQLISGVTTPVGAVSVKIGGQTATVQGSAAPVGSVPGLMQINVTVPTGTAAGPAVPLLVTVGTATSQAAVTLAVK